MIRYVHGSADSTDLDVIYVFEELPSARDCHAFCRQREAENRNIIVIRDGIVTQCFKGIPDEVNNALLTTHPLHPQEYPLLIQRPVERDIFLKDITVTRKILSPLSQSPLRRQAKEALRAPWPERVAAMNALPLTQIDFDAVGKWNREDLLKSIAFQLGQGIGLHQGVELYTKADIAAFLPELQPYLYRESKDACGLQEVLMGYVHLLSQTETRTLPEGRTQLLSSGAVYDIYREKRIRDFEYDKEEAAGDGFPG